MAEVHVPPLLLTLKGPCILCWGLRGGMAVVHARPFRWPLGCWSTNCFVLSMLNPFGVHVEVHVSPLLLALWGLLPLCKSLKGRMAEVHVTPLLLTLTGPCISGWGL